MGSFGSVMKGNYAPKGKVVVVKRFFGEGNSLLKNIAKEAKMLESICHPNATYRRLFKASGNNDGLRVLQFQSLWPQPSNIQFVRVFKHP